MPRRFARVTALAALIAVPAAAAIPPATLSVDGLGGVKIGMSVRQAEQVIGPLEVTYLNDDGGCGEAVPKRPWIPGAGLMVEGRTIVRIDVSQGEREPKATTRTDAGIGIGSTIAEVRRAYGRHLKIEPHPYDNEDGRYLVIKGLKPGREIIFETFKGRVDSFRAGKSHPVEYIEGCA
jgi:hypothetical protein